MPKAKSLDQKEFNYLLLKDDLTAFRKKEGYSLEYISVHKLYRSKNYLSQALINKAITPSVLAPICEFIGTKAARYKIEKPEPKPEPKPESVPEAKNQEPSLQEQITELYSEHPEIKPVTRQAGWEVKVRVDEDFETVMMKVLKNGEEMAIARCYFFSKDDLGIIQAISYAAHQCYKHAQQNVLAQQEADTTLRKEAKAITEINKDPGDTRAFKNWILKFKEDNSKVGRLARYVDSIYAKIPSHGERKLRMFFQIDENGRPHLDTFNAIWPLYIKEAKAAECAGNINFIEAIG